MPPNTTDLLKELCGNFFQVTEDVIGVVISDSDGLVIASNTNPDPNITTQMDDEVVASINSLVEPVLNKIRSESSFKKFGTAQFDAEKYRFINIAAGTWTVTIVLTNLGMVDGVFPYAYILSEKIYRLLDGKDSVQIQIPRLSGLTGTLTKIPIDSKFSFKFILSGGDEVGKTSLVKKFVEGQFNDDYRATIGLNVLTHSYHFLDFEIKLTIFDLAGQQYFKRVRQAYYEGASAAFIVFDLTRENTFNEVRKWKQEMDTRVGNIPFCIIGNKADLTDQRKISFEQGMVLAEELGTSYMETSALTGQNVEDAFALIAYKKLSMLEEQAQSG
jgi:small GTP-binding protein